MGSVAQHLQMIKDFKYQSAKFLRTFDTYDHVDCYNYMNHMIILNY